MVQAFETRADALYGKQLTEKALAPILGATCQQPARSCSACSVARARTTGLSPVKMTLSSSGLTPALVREMH